MMQVSDNLAGFLGTVESIQEVVQKATSAQEVIAQAEAIGVDPELLDDLMRRLRSEEKRNFVQRNVTSKEIAEALFGLLVDSEPAGRPATAKLWANTRQALNELNARLRRAFGDMQSAVLELDGRVSPNLKQVGGTLLEMYDAAYATRLAFRPNMEELAALLADGSIAEPWQVSLVAAWRERNPESGTPTAVQLEERFLDPSWVESLAARGPGPWETLRTQAEAQRAHRQVGEALDQVSN